MFARFQESDGKRWPRSWIIKIWPSGYDIHSLPWKITTMLLRTVRQPIFFLCAINKSWRTLSHNQRVQTQHNDGWIDNDHQAGSQGSLGVPPRISFRDSQTGRRWPRKTPAAHRSFRSLPMTKFHVFLRIYCLKMWTNLRLDSYKMVF